MILERPKLLPESEVYDPPAVKQSEETLSALQANQLKCQVKRIVREAVHVGTALSDVCEKEKCNLLFIGPTGKSAVARFFLGSVSRYLLHHTKCSIWIARPNGWKPGNQGAFK